MGLWRLGFMNAEDMCVDYKLKFRIKFDKLDKGDFQFGLFLNQREFFNYYRPFKERYLYICLFKWNISIGWLT